MKYRIFIYRKHIHLLLPIFLILLTSFHVTGQVEELPLAKAVSFAFEHNPMLKQIEAQIDAGKNLWKTETGLVPPEVSFFREGMGGDGDAPFAEQRLSVVQSLESPFSAGSRLKSFKMEKEILEQKLLDYQKELRAEVKKSYIEVLFAENSLRLRNSQLQLAKELYDAVYARSESGMASGLDLLNAELQVAQAENDLDETTRSFHMARYTLFKTIGLPPEDQRYSITFSDTLFILEQKIDQSEAIASVTSHPRYVMATLRLEQKQLYEKSLRRDIIPGLYVSYYRQDYGQGFHFNGVETGIKIPLWYGLEQKGKINIARAQQLELSWEQEAVLLEMKEAIEHAWHSYDEYGKMVARYKKTIGSKSSQLQSLTLEAYRIGEIDLLSLLNAQQIYLSSRQQYLNALRQYYLQAVNLEKYLQEEIVY